MKHMELFSLKKNQSFFIFNKSKYFVICMSSSICMRLISEMMMYDEIIYDEIIIYKL